MSEKPEKKTLPELAAKVEELAKEFEAASVAEREADHEAFLKCRVKEEARKTLDAAMKALEACMQDMRVR